MISEGKNFLNSTQKSIKDKGKDKLKYIKISICISRDINKMKIQAIT